MAQNGETPLHIAAGQGKSECLQLLLNSVPSTAGVEAVTQDGLTPLHFAARAGSLKCVQLLLSRGASKSAKAKVRLLTPG